MLENHDQNIECRFRLAQSMFICKIGIEWLQNLLDQICKAQSIEPRADLFFCRIPVQPKLYLNILGFK